MQSAATISSLLPTPNGKRIVHYSDGRNKDIIAVIHKNFPTAVKQVTKHGAFKKLQGRDVRESAQNVWDFLKHNIIYKEDPYGSQDIRLPNRLLLDRVGDCKSFSLFAAATLAAMGYPVAFRYASYSSSEIPTHVYVITKDESGAEVIVDAVWKEFDSEKKYTHKRDHVMRVSTLSGIGGRDERRARRAARKEKRQDRREARQEKRGGAKGVQRIALAPGRAAFLSLVLLNFRGLATKLSKAVAKNPERLKKFWNKLGGDFNKLKKAIDNGKTKKRILGLDEYEIVGIGSAAALAATAAPIIIAVVKFLKGEGVEEDGDSKSLLETGLDALSKSGQKELPNNLAELDVADAESGSGGGGGGFLSDPKNLLLIGGAGLALILLTKK